MKSQARLGFGAWAVGGRDWGSAAGTEQAVATVKTAFDQGIRFFDTAPTYGDSEKVLGTALAEHRENVEIATKFGPRDDPAQSLELSLTRLRTDYVDLFQLHEPGDGFEYSLEALARLKVQGKAKAIGICNATPRQLTIAVEIAPLAACQGAYNLFDREAELRELPLCAGHGLSFLAYRPLASGALTGKFGPHFAEQLDPADHRRSIWWFKGRELQRRLAVHARLQELAAARVSSVSALALAWVLSRPGVSVVLAGARSETQVKENALAVSQPLQPSELQEIEAAVEQAYRPVRASPRAVAAARDWGRRERFIVERLDGATSYDRIAAQWPEDGRPGLLGAQVRQFADQLADAGMVVPGG